MAIKVYEAEILVKIQITYLGIKVVKCHSIRNLKLIYSGVFAFLQNKHKT